MAVNKVVNKSTKSHGAMRNVIEYVLQDKKVREGYVAITGPYASEVINWNNVYNAFLEEKRLWNKDSGRMYSHNIISFHKDEDITPEQCLEIGQKFVDRFFPNHQCLLGVHQDKDHLHIHIVTNSVSFIDGMKLHQTKRDLEKQKEFTNSLCLERGLSVADKGKHFDGTTIEEGRITSWNKDKYNLFQHNDKKSFVVNCAIALMQSQEECRSKDEFIERMSKRGWAVAWSDNKKHITFQNELGNKVRDSNLSKTFSLDINKEALLNEFERQNEIGLAKLKSERERATERERAKQLDKYEEEIKSAIQGTGTVEGTVGSLEEIDGGKKQPLERQSEEKRDYHISEQENRAIATERAENKTRSRSKGRSR